MIEIIRLRNEYADRLIQFFNEINTPDYKKDFSPHPFDAEHAERICGYKGRDLYYSVLLDRKKIIGYFMLRGWDEGFEIPSIGLCILKEYQSYGLGKTIMTFLDSLSRLNNCSKVMLKIKKENKVAQHLYLSLGFDFEKYNEEFLIGYKNITRKK